MARHHLPAAFGQHQEQLAGFITKTPEERYQEPQDTRPDLVQRVPQYLLASCRGVTQGSLSRIRKRMLSKSGVNRPRRRKGGATTRSARRLADRLLSFIRG